MGMFSSARLVIFVSLRTAFHPNENPLRVGDTNYPFTTMLFNVPGEASVSRARDNLRGGGAVGGLVAGVDGNGGVGVDVLFGAGDASPEAGQQNFVRHGSSGMDLSFLVGYSDVNVTRRFESMTTVTRGEVNIGPLVLFR